MVDNLHLLIGLIVGGPIIGSVFGWLMAKYLHPAEALLWLRRSAHQTIPNRRHGLLLQQIRRSVYSAPDGRGGGTLTRVGTALRERLRAARPPAAAPGYDGTAYQTIRLTLLDS